MDKELNAIDILLRFCAQSGATVNFSFNYDSGLAEITVTKWPCGGVKQHWRACLTPDCGSVISADEMRKILLNGDNTLIDLERAKWGL